MVAKLCMGDCKALRGQMQSFASGMVKNCSPSGALYPIGILLKAANEKVRTLTATRTDERMAKAVGALKASRKASDEAYRQLVKFVNAYALIEGDSKYLSFIDYVNTEIVHYKREVIGQKSGSAQTSGTTGRTTGGGSTGGSTGGTISDGTTPPGVEIEG